jgi:hypothetical protein
VSCPSIARGPVHVLAALPGTWESSLSIHDLVPDDDLLPTASGAQWGACQGRGDEPGTYVVETAVLQESCIQII